MSSKEIDSKLFGETGIDIAVLIQTILKTKKKIFFFGVLSAALISVSLFFLSPKYQASIVVKIGSVRFFVPTISKEDGSKNLNIVTLNFETAHNIASIIRNYYFSNPHHSMKINEVTVEKNTSGLVEIKLSGNNIADFKPYVDKLVKNSFKMSNALKNIVDSKKDSSRNFLDKFFISDSELLNKLIVRKNSDRSIKVFIKKLIIFFFIALFLGACFSLLDRLRKDFDYA